MNKPVLTPAEAERVLSLTNVAEPAGLRDRVVLETLYATGIRGRELVALCAGDLDVERGAIFIRAGKGAARCVPLTGRAQAWLVRYLREVRSTWRVASDAGDTMFLTQSGRPLTLWQLTRLVRNYLTASGLDAHGGCHLFRRTKFYQRMS